MVLFSHSLKFPSPRPENHRHLKYSDASFRSKISESITTILVEPELMSGAGFNKCFDLIHTANAAFSELAIEMEYPMTQWGAKLTNDYLTYTLHLLSLSNAVTAAVSRLTQAKMSILHAASLINTSPRPLNIISGEMLTFKFERPVISREERASSKHEQLLAQALILCRNIGFLALGFAVSGLCGGDRPYLEMRKSAGGLDDSLVKDVDSRFYQELKGGMVLVEVKEVNMATERLQSAIIYNGRCSQLGVEELKRRLKVLENSIHVVEKQANHLFSHVLSARNKLLANIRLPE